MMVKLITGNVNMMHFVIHDDYTALPRCGILILNDKYVLIRVEIIHMSKFKPGQPVQG